MFSTLSVLGWIAALLAAGRCCLSREYATMEEQCCPMCREGSYVRKDCTVELGTSCRPCDNKTFMNQPNGLNKCFPCSSCDQARGLFALQECTPTADTVCDVTAGYFCKAFMEDTGCSLAQKHTGCPAGHMIKEPGTSRSDTVCEPCQPGSFSLHGVDCTVWTKCPESQVELTEGSTTSDVICGALSRRRHLFYIPVSLFLLTVVVLMISGCRWWVKNRSEEGKLRPFIPPDSSAASDQHAEKHSHPGPSEVRTQGGPGPIEVWDPARYRTQRDPGLSVVQDPASLREHLKVTPPKLSNLGPGRIGPILRIV